MTECCVDWHVVHAWEDETERAGASASAKAKAYASAVKGSGKAYAKGSGKLYASALEEACEGCHADANSHTLHSGLERRSRVSLCLSICSSISSDSISFISLFSKVLQLRFMHHYGIRSKRRKRASE